MPAVCLNEGRGLNRGGDEKYQLCIIEKNRKKCIPE